MCDYWSSEVTQVYGVAPWIFLSEVRLDDDHLVFRWDDCFYKFAALKLFPPGSEIVISFYTDLLGFSQEEQESGEFAAPYLGWAGCIYFVADQFSQSADELDAYEIRLNIPQFRAVFNGEDGDPDYEHDPSPSGGTFCGAGDFECQRVQNFCNSQGIPGLSCGWCITRPEDENGIDPPLEITEENYGGAPGTIDNEGLYHFPKDVIKKYMLKKGVNTDLPQDEQWKNCRSVAYIDENENGEFDPPGEIHYVTECNCYTENIINFIRDLPIDGNEGSPLAIESRCAPLGLRMEVRICGDGASRPAT